MTSRSSFRRAWAISALIALSFIVSDSLRAGSVILHEMMSPSIGANTVGISNSRRLLVYLPDHYYGGKDWFPVIYWIPGWGNWATKEYRVALDEAIRDGQIPPAIVVSIDVREGIVFLNSPGFGRWEDFLFNEVIPYVDRTYRTIPTPRGRAIMGHSMGGYAAMILPLLHPGVFGAVGLNDASVWAGSSFLPSWRLPSSFDGYWEADPIPKVFIQFGIAVTPNPLEPLHFDLPFTAERVPEVADKWESYCPMLRETLARHRPTLEGLATVAVIVPSESALTNRQQNLTMIRNLRDLGLAPIQLDMPGYHDGHREERFIALAKETLTALAHWDARSVSPTGKQAVRWAQLKTAR